MMPRGLTEKATEAWTQPPHGPGKRPIGGAQSRPRGEGCGAGYFYQATTEGNEHSHEIILE